MVIHTQLLKLNKMVFKKRTLNQQAESVNNGDYTGGYDYIPWIWFEKEGRTKAILATILFGVGVVLECSLASSFSPTAQIIAGIGAMCGGIFLHLWTYRQFKQMKKGISS